MKRKIIKIQMIYRH